MVEEDPVSACGCSNDSAPELSRPENRPGLSAIAYRLGTHSSFLERMLDTFDGVAAVAKTAVPRSRDPGDPAVGLLDAFALVCDVLSFYQERHATEGFLRTATEHRSVLELARTLGYELQPGLSAQARLAFLVEDAPGSPAVVQVPAGTPVGSVPAQNELPVTYETSEAVEARAAWNTLRATVLKPQHVGTDSVVLKGATLRVDAGEVLVLRAEDAWKAVTITDVRLDSGRGETHVGWSVLGGSGSIQATPRVYLFRQRASVFGHNAPDPSIVLSGSRAASVEAKRAKTERGTSLLEGRVVHTDTEWDDFELTEGPLPLDSVYAKARVGSATLLVDGENVRLSTVRQQTHGSRADFAISAKVTTITLEEGSPALDEFDRRGTTVYVDPEELPVAEVLDSSPVAGASVRLDRAVPELPPDRVLIVTGTEVARAARADLVFVPFSGPERTLALDEPLQVLEEPAASPDGKLRYVVADASGVTGTVAAEPAAIVRPTQTVGELVTVFGSFVADDGRSELQFTSELVRSYDRRSVRIFGNVALGSHGESVLGEVLGSGDPTLPVQRFTLKKKPVSRTWTDGSVATSLEVRVDGSLWEEADTLYGRTAREEVFEVETRDDESTTLVFGAGAAHLPGGQENVVATYRTGSGLAGAVGPAQLTVLKKPVLGLRGVTNPLAAEGADDPESLEEARTNAPLHVTSFDRVVSLQDYEDFVRALPGVGKAVASPLWSGAVRLVHVTVALADGTPLAAGSDLEGDLLQALKAAGSGGLPVMLQGHVPRSFRLRANLVVDPRFVPELTRDAVRSAVLDEFSFARRGISRPVTASEVLALIGGVTGVRAAHLVELAREDELGGSGAPPLAARLPAFPARYRAGEGVIAAELLTVDPNRLDLSLSAS